MVTELTLKCSCGHNNKVELPYPILTWKKEDCNNFLCEKCQTAFNVAQGLNRYLYE